ncbi:hypothetical protein OQA88_5234 [Cercophora sp. LCS_1]
MPPLLSALLLAILSPVTWLVLGKDMPTAAQIVAPNTTDADVEYFDFETAQLTPEFIANLAGKGIANVPLFDFAAPGKPITPRPQCKAYSGTVDDPASVSFPLYEGRTCYPTYVVNVTSVAQIQLAVNFARNANLRLVIKNKGHDFNAKSTGAGGLSVFTGFLRDIRFISNYSSGSYKGSAFKIGTGVEVGTLYEETKKLGVSVVGGIGLAGGYAAGGGHSPLTSVYGLGADQILSLEVVLPDGRFALRGAGGSTFGVVTSAVIAAYPKMPVATLTYSITTTIPTQNVTAGKFWAAVQAFLETSPRNADAGHYVYHKIVCQGPAQPELCTLALRPHWANRMTATELEAWNAPLFARFAALGIPLNDVVFNEFPSLYQAFNFTFPAANEGAGGSTIHAASRLFPRENPELLVKTRAAIRHALESGGRLLAYNIKTGVNPAVNQDNAVLPAWRNNMMFAMLTNPWTEGPSIETITADSRKLVEWMDEWRAISPGAGSHLNEGDINEPEFQKSFYGMNYPRLYELKQRYDPTGTLYAQTAVGSEDWYVTGQVPYYPITNGRLCRKQHQKAK